MSTDAPAASRSDKVLTARFRSCAELGSRVGEEILVSEWVAVSQTVIDDFARVTGDNQWIHTDPARAAHESPFGSTIAHGFLVVSLIPRMFEGSLTIEDTTSSINYGFNKLRFTGAVKSGTRIRGRFSLKEYKPLEGGAQLSWTVEIEREGEARPAMVAEWLIQRFGGK